MIGRIEALISSVVFAFMFYFTKKSGCNAAEVAVVRGIGNLIILYVQSRLTKESLFGSHEDLFKCISRGVLSMISIGLMIESNILLPISVYGVISRMNVFGVFIMSMLYMGKKFTWRPLLLGLGSFFGVTLIIKPSIYGFSVVEDSGIEFSFTAKEILGLVTAGLFLLANGLSRVYVSSIANDVSFSQSIFYLNLLLLLFYSLFLIFTPIQWDIAKTGEYVGIILTSYLYQLLLTDCTRREPDPNMIAIIQSSLIICTMSIDVWLMGTSLNVYNMFGAIIVGITTVYAMMK